MYEVRPKSQPSYILRRHVDQLLRRDNFPAPQMTPYNPYLIQSGADHRQHSPIETHREEPENNDSTKTHTTLTPTDDLPVKHMKESFISSDIPGITTSPVSQTVPGETLLALRRSMCSKKGVAPQRLDL